MRKSLRAARIIQMIGLVFIIVGIMGCAASDMAQSKIGWGIGLSMILSARIYEWLTKE